MYRRLGSATPSQLAFPRDKTARISHGRNLNWTIQLVKNKQINKTPLDSPFNSFEATVSCLPSCRQVALQMVANLHSANSPSASDCCPSAAKPVAWQTPSDHTGRSRPRRSLRQPCRRGSVHMAGIGVKEHSKNGPEAIAVKSNS